MANKINKKLLPMQQPEKLNIVIVFPKDSEAIFSKHSTRTFGGATVQLYILAKELSKNKNINIISFIPRYENITFEDKNNFTLLQMYNENDNIIKQVFSLHRAIKQTSPQIIVQRGLTLKSCLLSIYCKIRKIKFIFMFAHDIESHGQYQNSRKKCYLFKLLINCSSRLFAQNTYEYNTILKYHQVANKLRILKKGIEIPIIKTNPKKEFDCVWIARCERWKNPEIFIQLAEKNKKMKFLMICSKVDQDIKFFEEIKSKALSCGNIHFMSFVPHTNIFEFLAISKVYCITSEMEGDWPMSFLEAGSCGLPILSLHLNYDNIFQKYNAGFWNNSDFTALHKNLSILINDKKIYKTKSEGIQTFIKENYNLKKNVQIFLDEITIL